MASSIAWITTDLSIDFLRATASAICNSSSLLAATPVAIMSLRSRISVRGFRLSHHLASLQAFLDELVGERKLRLRDVRIWEPHTVRFLLIRHIHQHVTSFNTEQSPLEAPPPVDSMAKLEARLVAGKAGVILERGQWAIDTRRGNLQHVLLRDRVGGFQNLGQRAREARAIPDLHSPLGPLGHHL